MRAVGGVGAALLVLIAAGAAAMPWLMPADEALARRIAAGAIFAASYLALAIGKVPGLAIDRAGVALVGASLMVAPVRCRWPRPIARSTSRRSPCCSA